LSQIRLFLNIYIRPLRAFGPVIDEARLAFAVGIALLAVFAVQAPRYAEYRSASEWARRYVKEHPAPPPARSTNAAAQSPAPGVPPATQPTPSSALSPRTPPDASGKPAPGEANDGDEEDSDLGDAAGLLAAISPMFPGSAADQFIGLAAFHYLAPVLSLSICFVPAALLIVTLLQGLGRFTNVLFRDYLTLLVCGLMAWAAAYLSLGTVNFALSYLHPAWHNAPALWWGASLYFLTLTICAIRTLLGASLLHGAGAAAGAWVAGVAGVWLYSISGNVTWYLASPCVLYYLWANLQGSFHSIGYGLTSRQRMKRNLESLTINPRDADAHCQLGLIYLQRRQYEPAAERFQKAIETDPSEPDAWYQLGRIARLQGRYADALSHCQTAARLDDKHSGSEVWRELGAVQFLSGRHEAARYALEKFIQRREYDPEGECWYGRVLAALGEPKAARQAFQTAVEAARTMPAPRKYQVRCWGAEANKELRALRAPASRPAAAPEVNRGAVAHSKSGSSGVTVADTRD
jgi:tetratricopeptide (TPR) repeat protein